MKPTHSQRSLPRRIRLGCPAVSAECFTRFFDEDMSPHDFLNRLHNTMADYVICADAQKACSDLATVADNVAFLQMVYDLVDRAMRTDEKPINTEEKPWDEQEKRD